LYNTIPVFLPFYHCGHQAKHIGGNDMKLNQALENIGCVAHKLPKEEFSCIRDNKEEAIPSLLECVKKVADMGDSLPEDYDAHTYAMFLLAEFRVNEAFQHLVAYLEFDNDFTHRLLSDTLTEDFGSILASVATIEDISRLKAIVENTELYMLHRLAALDAMQALYAEDVYSQDDYFAYLRHLLDTHSDDDEFLAFVVLACRSTGNGAFLPIIEPLYEEGLVADDIASLSFTREILSTSDPETSKKRLKQSKNSSFIRDSLKAVSSWYAHMPKPDLNRKIGRNEPCPCGSGKKYKKCCGA